MTFPITSNYSRSRQVLGGVEPGAPGGRTGLDGDGAGLFREGGSKKKKRKKVKGQIGKRKEKRLAISSPSRPPESGTLRRLMLPPRSRDSRGRQGERISRVGDCGKSKPGLRSKLQGAQLFTGVKGIRLSKAFVVEALLSTPRNQKERGRQENCRFASCTYRRGASFARRGAGSNERRGSGDAQCRLHFCKEKVTSVRAARGGGTGAKKKLVFQIYGFARRKTF